MWIFSFIFGNKENSDELIFYENDGNISYEFDNSEIINFHFPNGYRYCDFENFEYREPPEREIRDFSWKPKCPNCKIELEKLPKRKTKCKNCGHFYYHKYFPLEYERKIINEEENQRHEDLWGKFWPFKTAIWRLSRYSEKNIWDEVEKFYKNGQTFENIISDYCKFLSEQKLKNSYFSEVAYISFIAKTFFDDIGEPDVFFNQQYHFFQLLDGYFRSAKIVKINNEWEVLDIKQELLNPQLPHKNCPHWDICQCFYSPYFPDILTIWKKPNKANFEKEKQFIDEILQKYSIKIETKKLH